MKLQRTCRDFTRPIHTSRAGSFQLLLIVPEKNELRHCNYLPAIRQAERRGVLVARYTSSSCPGVRLFVASAETVDRYMGIELGGGEARVAQEFLHRPEISTTVEQVGRCAVP